MSITRHEGRMQVNCDHCPAAYPHAYAEEDFAVMIADAKAAGWQVRKLPAAAAATARDRDTTDLFGAPPRIAGAKTREPYTHACPACAEVMRKGSLL